MSRLTALRDQLDAIDNELLGLLSRRAQVVFEVATIKRQLDLPLEDLARERAMLAALVAKNRGPFPDRAILHVFRCIIAQGKRLMLPVMNSHRPQDRSSSVPTLLR